MTVAIGRPAVGHVAPDQIELLHWHLDGRLEFEQYLSPEANFKRAVSCASKLMHDVSNRWRFIFLRLSDNRMLISFLVGCVCSIIGSVLDSLFGFDFDFDFSLLFNYVLH